MGENLGQHFLKDKDILREIVAAGNISEADTTLEVGPGMGALTKKLLETGANVVAVEKDPKLFTQLKHIFKAEIGSDRLTLHQGDIRDTDFANLTKGNYKVVANIPYYLTSELLVKLLETAHKPERIVLLIQKEVAERIVATDGKESRLSLLVKSHASPELVRVVEPESFDPPPAVDSAILALSNISDDFFADIEKQKFQALIKRGFGHKRKTLANNLKSDPNYTKEQITEVLKSCDLNPAIRAERLNLDDWKRLYIELSTN